MSVGGSSARNNRVRVVRSGHIYKQMFDAEVITSKFSILNIHIEKTLINIKAFPS